LVPTKRTHKQTDHIQTKTLINKLFGYELTTVTARRYEKGCEEGRTPGRP
jgi:ribosomal protein S17E